MAIMENGVRVYPIPYRITRSTMFQSGDHFTAADMSGRVSCCTKNVQTAMIGLVRDGVAASYVKDGKTYYHRQYSARKVITKPFVSGEMPVVESREHLNPWVFNPYIEETLCA